MRESVFGHSIIIAIMTLGLVVPGLDCSARPELRQSFDQRNSLKRFLVDYLGDAYPGNDLTTRYSSAFVDLNDNGVTDVIVYITGRTWCGSGGCRMLVLAPKQDSYEVVAQTTITRLPIRVLPIKSHGWHDLGVWVQGGGIQPGYEADLPFDGKNYPSNPSTPPARRLNVGTAGRVVIPAAAVGRPLF